MRKISAVVVAAAALTGVAADWPQFLGPQRKGIAPQAKLARTWPEEGPKVLWTFDLGQGFAGASIRDGKVYVLDRVADAQDVLRCLSLADGKELWSCSFEAPGKLDHNGSRSVPTVDEKYVFAIGPFGQFYCVEQATHKPVWQKQLLEEFESKRPNWGVAQSPLLYRDWVIAAPLGRKAGVVAFEKDTGKIIWQSPPFDVMAYTSPMIATIGGVEQVLMAGNRRVAGISLTDGKILWSSGAYRCSIPIPSPTAIGDGRVFLTGGYDAGSIMLKVQRGADGFTVEELFKEEKLGSQLHQPLLYEGHLYLNCNTNSRQDGLVCMDLDGKVKWQTGRAPNFERGNLILADGVILIMDGRTGELRMLQPDPAGYKELAKARILSGRDIWAPMALSDGKLVLRDQRQMKCLEVGSGSGVQAGGTLPSSAAAVLKP